MPEATRPSKDVSRGVGAWWGRGHPPLATSKGEASVLVGDEIEPALRERDVEAARDGPSRGHLRLAVPHEDDASHAR